MNILVRAYLDNNLGDDLMIKLLVEKFPNFNFFIYTNSSMIKNTYKDYENVKVRKVKDMKNDLKMVDAFVTIGGSIFQIKTFKQHLSRFLKIMFLLSLKFRKKKVVTLGANLGPFSNKISYKLVEWELRLNNLTTVRDINSKRIIDSFRGNYNIHLADDIVYNLEWGKSLHKEGLGISTYRSSAHDENNLENYSTLAALADNYIEKTGKKVTLFAFDSETENDVVSAHHIYNFSRNKDKISIVPYLGNIKEFLDEFNKCEKIIAIRFHSAILSDILEIPFLPIIYSNKMTNFLDDNNYKGERIHLKSLNKNINIDSLVDKIISGDELYNNFKTHLQNSSIHFEEFKKLFKY
jgi:colanic acid/amylovoran biosynthesis protein